MNDRCFEHAMFEKHQKCKKSTMQYSGYYTHTDIIYDGIYKEMEVFDDESIGLSVEMNVSLVVNLKVLWSRVLII